MTTNVRQSIVLAEPPQPPATIRVITCTGRAIDENLPRWIAYVRRCGQPSLSRHPAWLAVLAEGLRHQPYCIEASKGDRLLGLLPLAYVKSLLFGKFLAGLPYLNQGGVLADDDATATAIIDRAIELADHLAVRHMELRHERPIDHPRLGATLTSKVHMRLALPDSTEALWDGLKAKVRNKVRKGENQGFTVHWGERELLPEFYQVFSRNMRDLGTPVFSKRLFGAILRHFAGESELCVVRHGQRPIAAALLLHGGGVSEVPSASSLREYGSTNANDLLYWRLLQRAVERGQAQFDFGRSTVDSNTFVFKKKWGAQPEPAVWQYYVRHGSAGDLRIESGKYNRLIRVWQCLPVLLTRLIGPPIVRGIP